MPGGIWPVIMLQRSFDVARQVTRLSSSTWPEVATTANTDSPALLRSRSAAVIRHGSSEGTKLRPMDALEALSCVGLLACALQPGSYALQGHRPAPKLQPILKLDAMAQHEFDSCAAWPCEA